MDERYLAQRLRDELGGHLDEIVSDIFGEEAWQGTFRSRQAFLDVLEYNGHLQRFADALHQDIENS